jgi:hypothetical protein
MKNGSRTGWSITRGAVLAAALFGAGCAAVFPQPETSPVTPGEVVRVEGMLTGEGIRCQAMRDGDDRLYTLIGSIGTLRRGDRVVVEGTIAQTSGCTQGRTINIHRIERQQ